MTLRILLIDDSADDREALVRLLRDVEVEDYQVEEAEDGLEGFEKLRAGDFDCALVDFSLPRDDGLTVLREVQLRYPELPTVMMTGSGNERVAVEALKSGAQDYLSKNELSGEGVCKAIGNALSAKRQEAEILRRANYDELTGLANRRLFYERLDQALARTGMSVCHAVLLFDLDGFKPINDTYGHQAGDHILKEVADRATRSLRRGDIVARLGGDEFVVLVQNLAGPPAVVSCGVAGRLREAICDRPFDIDGDQVYVGSSFGVALYPQMAETKSELLRRADEAMYEMKHGLRCAN